jgi:hypothetical protein
MADNNSENRGRLIKGGAGCGLILLGIGLLLFIVLFPMSFSYLDFYEVILFI